MPDLKIFIAPTKPVSLRTPSPGAEIRIEVERGKCKQGNFQTRNSLWNETVELLFLEVITQDTQCTSRFASTFSISHLGSSQGALLPSNYYPTKIEAKMKSDVWYHLLFSGHRTCFKQSQESFQFQRTEGSEAAELCRIVLNVKSKPGQLTRIKSFAKL